jgi:hypothetical protein
MGAIGDYLDHHATILVAWEVAGPIEAGRQDWDPGMAARIAAHVTVAYPQEAPISDLLVERVQEASKRVHSGSYQRQDESVTVEEVTITAFDGREWGVLTTCALDT